jgi:hypothetical protein
MDLLGLAIFSSRSDILSSRKLGGKYVRSALHVDLLPHQRLFQEVPTTYFLGAFSGTDEDDDYTPKLKLLIGRPTLESFI